jgi:hypothetical protein
LSYRVPIFLSAWFGYVFLVTPTVATLESSTAREMCVTPCDAVGIVMAQSSVMPSIDEINREIEALAVAGEAKPIPEDVLRRWFPSDDLDDNAAMLRALGFNVQVHDVERDAHPLREIERREGTKRLLTAQEILKSLINGQVIEGPSPGAVAFLVVAIGISIKQDGRRMIAGSVGLESP